MELDAIACETLTTNRPLWQVHEADIRSFSGKTYEGVDLLAGGVPCPPFSIAGKQLGHADERDLFPAALRLVEEVRPRAVLLENVRGMATQRFEGYRRALRTRLSELGYESEWQVLNAAAFGVPQLRPRWLLVAFKNSDEWIFDWPDGVVEAPTVGQALHHLMASGGWPGADSWAQGASGIGPTVVGGSTKHGGPDLGPSRTKREWAKLGVDGHGVADAPPAHDFPLDRRPRLTIEMVAQLQGFPEDWTFQGKKTARYRQVGNAFPPPVAQAVGERIRDALQGRQQVRRHLFGIGA